ncbi:MAG: hypothetical protein K8S87_00590 [Planctomycetes bacterium]|nr:hypothetical protein [Planctomycetota bacterium]
MINQTYNSKKSLKYSQKSLINDINSRGLQKIEAIRKTAIFDKTSVFDEKLNLIIDTPDRW